MQVLGGEPVDGQRGEADRGGGDRAEALLEARRGGTQLARAGLGQQDRELVAAEAAEHVGGAQVGRERAGDGAQQVVTGGVAAGVVDGLEVVEVDHDQAERAAVVADVVAQLGLEALGEAAAVERAGQRVGARERLQLAALAARG